MYADLRFGVDPTHLFEVDLEYTERAKPSYREPAEPWYRGLFGPTESIWELFLQTAGTEILSRRAASCEAAIKMMDIFLAHGANSDVCFIVSRLGEIKCEGGGELVGVTFPSKLHRVSLQQLVQVRKPPNSDTIGQHMRRTNNKGSFTWPFARFLRLSLGNNCRIPCLINEELENSPFASIVVMDSRALGNLDKDATFLGIYRSNSITKGHPIHRCSLILTMQVKAQFSQEEVILRRSLRFCCKKDCYNDM